jgi:hydrogenase 3 maturation protease
MTQLEDILREGACLVGTGNPLRRDDGVGVWLAERLEGAAAAVFNVEDVPESYVGEIARTGCRNVVIMDAVDAGLEPGTVVFGPLNELGERPGLSTHKLALSLCGRYLEAHGQRTFLLGIVPGDLDFGAGLTPAVERAAGEVRDLILRACPPHHGERQ